MSTASIDERFEKFHEAHPEVLTTLEEMAAQWFATGKRKIAIRTLWEVMRWNSGLRTAGDRGYAFNDHFPSRYARLIVQRHPEWATFFEFRTLRRSRSGA